MFGNIRNTARLAHISFVLARHDALFLLKELGINSALIGMLSIFSIGSGGKKRPGQKIAAALSKLGPAFIKLGQALSTRSDILGEEFAADLAVLQDRMAPFSGKEARRIIEKELGKNIDELFSAFNDEPVAAASIAQVHFAKDIDGRKLAVKVLRPEIEKNFARDVELLMWLATIAEKRLPKRLKPREAVLKLAETVRIEMDLRLEAAAAHELDENFKNDDTLVVPQIIWLKTSRRVLTTSWVNGININDHEALIKAGHDLNKVLKKAATVVFHMILRDGFFHADLHPGNLFINKKGNIVVVDFGIMGRLDRKTQRYLAEMLYAFLKRDYMRVAEVHFDAGYVPKNQSVELFAQACRSIGEPILGLPQNKISVAKLLAQLFKITDDFQMEMQPQLLLLQKTMMLTEGIGRKLNPNVNMWQMAEPLIEKWAMENMSVKAKIEDCIDEVKYFMGKAREFAVTVDQLSQIVTKDGIKLHPETVAALRKGRKSRRLVMPALVVAVVSSLITIMILFTISAMIIGD